LLGVDQVFGDSNPQGGKLVVVRPKVFIFASGLAKRWARVGPGKGKETDIVKQLLPADGEPVLVRTVRQLKARGLGCTIVTPHQAIKQAMMAEFTDDVIDHFIDFLDAGSPPLLVDTIAATTRFWAERNIGLMGDVWFSDRAMDIITTPGGFHFYGRIGFSHITKGQAELFAWSWDSTCFASVTQALRASQEQSAALQPDEVDGAGWNHGGLWQLYRGCAGLPLVGHARDDSGLWVEISDFTDDFDTPEQYRTWQRQYARRIIHQGRMG
jgi:hypothetical protein